MQINRHGSFYIRNGWPTKIIDAIRTDSHIFSPNNELLAVDTIGVGRVMIKSMRYWATAMGIAAERKDQQGVYHELTPLGNLIEQNDLFCSNKGTLWLLHRNLARSKNTATAWYWAFNVFEDISFTKASFSSAFYSFLQGNGESYSKVSVEKEFDCFKNTYVADQEFVLSKVIDENTLPFFAPLSLIEYHGSGTFEKHKSLVKDIPIHVLLACILMDNADHLKENKQINIDHLLNGEGQVCRYMILSYSALIELLQRLENLRYLRLITNFGSRYIEINETDVGKLLAEHYSKNGGANRVLQ